MNQDQDIDKLLENFEVKPLTEGLGFHHSVSDKKKIRKSLADRANELDRDLKNHIKQIKHAKSSEPVLDHGDLTPFYTQEEQTPELEINLESEVALPQDEKGLIRLAAWLFDTVLILSFAFLTLFIAYSLVGTYLRPFDQYIFSATGIVDFAVLGGLFYLFYFSLLDATAHSTYGKNLFNLELTTDGKPISFKKSFARTLFSLFGLGLLGLPTILRTQDLFFNTKIIRKQ